MKKIVGFTGIALALGLAVGCWAPRGDVYLSFDWTYAPEWFETDDPNLPEVIYRSAEYLTDEGSYYFEYYHDESGYIRWISYTLAAHRGGAPCIPGEDARFEIFLSAFSNPDLIQWQSVTGTAGNGGSGAGSVAASAAPRRGDQRRVPTYEATRTSGGWTLSITGGVIEPMDR